MCEQTFVWARECPIKCIDAEVHCAEVIPAFSPGREQLTISLYFTLHVVLIMKVMCAHHEVKLTLWTLMAECLLYVSAKLHLCAYLQ